MKTRTKKRKPREDHPPRGFFFSLMPEGSPQLGQVFPQNIRESVTGRLSQGSG
jgi:hypothetical protein